MPPSSCSALINKIMRRERRARPQEPPALSREQRQALIAKLLHGLEVDDPVGRLPDLTGGFLFRFPLIDEENPDRMLTITFAKAGYRTFMVKGFDDGDEWRIGLRTLRGDVPVHHAAAELVLAAYGTEFLTNATP